jgi:hypothetical protein
VSRYLLLPAVVAAATLVACATVEPSKSAENRPDKVYATGSRIPVKDGSGSAYVRSVDNKQGVDDMMEKRDVIIPPKGGPQ